MAVHNGLVIAVPGKKIIEFADNAIARTNKLIGDIREELATLHLLPKDLETKKSRKKKENLKRELAQVHQGLKMATLMKEGISELDVYMVTPDEIGPLLSYQ
jgi:hypothetical protein